MRINAERALETDQRRAGRSRRRPDGQGFCRLLLDGRFPKLLEVGPERCLVLGNGVWFGFPEDCELVQLECNDHARELVRLEIMDGTESPSLSIHTRGILMCSLGGAFFRLLGGEKGFREREGFHEYQSRSRQLISGCFAGNVRSSILVQWNCGSELDC